MKTHTTPQSDLHAALDDALRAHPQITPVRIAVGIDISGSLLGSVRKIFAAELASNSKIADAEIHLLTFDDKVRSEQKLDRDRFMAALDQITPSRGGTSFIDVVNRLASFDPTVIILLSDLKGPTGNSPGEIPVIWVSPDDDTPDPPFGHLVQLNR